MSICQDCSNDMLDKKTKNCSMPILIVNNVRYKRDTKYFDNNKRCHDCNIENKKGNVHHLGCDMERCPICKGQLISCGCLDGKIYSTEYK